MSSTTSTKASAKGGGGGFGFLKSGFKKAQASIERSVEQTVTAIAYRADNGKNPGLVCASLHYCGMNNDTLTMVKCKMLLVVVPIIMVAIIARLIP